MLHITNLDTNWKIGARTRELGPLTLWSAPTGAGKSADLEAIEWTLFGRIGHYLGRRDVKKPNLLWRSKPASDSTLYSKVTLSDGTRIEVEQTAAGGYGKRTVTLPDGTTIEGKANDPLPFVATQSAREIEENLFGGARTAAKWLSHRLGITTRAILDEADTWLTRQCAIEQKKVNDDEIEEERIEALYRKAGVSMRSFLTDDEGSILIEDPEAAAERLQRLGADLEKQAKGARQKADAFAGREEGEVFTEQDLVKARKTLETLDALLAKSQEAETQATEIEGVILAFKNAKKALEETSKPDPEAQARVENAQTAKTMIEATLARAEAGGRGADKCLCCGAPVDLSKLRKRLARCNKVLADLGDVHQRAQAYETAQSYVERARINAKKLRKARPALWAEVKGGLFDFQASASIEEKRDKAASLVEQIEARIVGAQAPQMAEDTAVGLERRAARLTLAYKAFVEGIQRRVKKALKAFVTEINAGMPPAFGEVQVKLGRQSVEIGLLREGTLGAPSEGQMTFIVLMIAKALAAREVKATEEAGERETLRILVNSDVSMDEPTLMQLQTALVGTDASVFLHTTRTCPLHPEWTLIQPEQVPETTEAQAELDALLAQAQKVSAALHEDAVAATKGTAQEAPEKAKNGDGGLDPELLIVGQSYRTERGKTVEFVAIEGDDLVVERNGKELRLPLSYTLYPAQA